ncbi:MAG: DUF72 domain-containing protein [Myxococcota bacterium]
MNLRIGTSGFAYKEWKGSFYPEKIRPAEMLSFYAEQLPAVEINNTFYRMPKREVVEGWAAQVPDDFRFAIKASRRITHQKRIQDAGEELDYLLSVLEPLGDRLGTLLFQLPPYLRCDVGRLEAFLDQLDGRAPAALEFRHASWQEDAVARCLRERGVAWVVTETEEEQTPLCDVAEFGYLRLRRTDYDEASLRDWWHRLRPQRWSELFVFFKHEDDGTGPAWAEEFLAIAGHARARSVRTAADVTEEAV